METLKKDLAGLLLITLIQTTMMFVMFFVRFRQFSIIRFFLIPMLIMQALVIGLVVLRMRKHAQTLIYM